MAQHKVTFAIGTGQDKDGNSLAYRLPEMKQFALKTTAELFGGYSATEGRGGWIHEGKLIEETNLVVVVFTDLSRIMIVDHARTLATTFNQTSVLVAIEEVVELQFVEQ